MAEQSKPNTFSGGMVTDLDPGYQPKDTYFTGLNIRVITNGDNSYSLENIKGPKLEWNLNTHSDGIYYSGTNRYVIHGAVIVDDYVITIEGQLTSTNKNWKIRKYTIDHEGDLSIYGDGGLDGHLWSGAGLFSDDAGEIEMEAAVETDTIHRIYCTDGITSLKSINVKESLATSDVNDFTAFKPSIGAQAQINNYSDSGGQLACGAYSYVYRLAAAGQSNYSDWSSISSPVNVLLGDISQMDSLTLEGGTGTTLSTASITVNITDIPQEYEIIQVAAIHYLSNEANEVAIIEEGDIDGTTYSFVHSGFETKTVILGGIASVLISNLTWDSCKSLAQKDNKLYAGNLTSSLMDLDLKSYRVKSYKIEDSGSEFQFSTHSEQHNPHRHYNGSGGNRHYDLSSLSNDRSIYKFINKNFGTYASPKFVLGAETPGYSSGGYGYRITFTQESYRIDTEWADSPHGAKETGINYLLNGSSSTSHFANHNARPYKVGDSYNSSSYGGGKPGPSNPLWDNEFRGFKRGECYRFGIVCYDLKGVPGFVHHIGDIKMPDAMDQNVRVLNAAGDGTAYNSIYANSSNNINTSWIPISSSGEDNSTTYAQALIPRIEVRFPSSIANQISGYKIVRVEMSDDDKMILTQGLLNHCVRYKSDSNTPNEMDNVAGIGYLPHGLTWSYTNGTNISAYEGNVVQHGYTLDTPDATLGNKSLSYGSGYDLKILYPVEMDMAGIKYYQENNNSDLSAQQQSGAGGESDIWGYDDGNSHNGSSGAHPNSAQNDVARQVNIAPVDCGLSFYTGVTSNLPDLGSGENLNAYGTYHSYKYRPPSVTEDLTKHKSGSSEILLNSLKRPIKYSKKVVSGEEVGMSVSGMDYTFKNYAVNSQTASSGGGTAIISSAYYFANDSGGGGIDHQTQGYLMNGGTSMFVSLEGDANMPLPSAITVDNASDSNIPTNHWFGHSHTGYVHGSRLWRYNTSKYICEVIRDTSSGWEQFGGTSDGVIRNNRFISSSKFTKKNVTSFLINEGDTYVDYYTQGKSLQTGTTSVQSYGQSFPVESSYNIGLRQGVFLGSSDTVNFSVEDNYLYNTAYSIENNLKSYAAKPNNFNSNDFFRSKIAASQTKLVGETFDAWSVFPASDFIELNLAQGKLTDLVNYKNNLYAIQDRGVSLLSINPRALITGEGAAADIQIVSGTGTAIERYDYLTTQYGSQHYNKSVITPTGFYFIDSDKGELIKFDGNSINPASLSLGYKSYIESITKDKIIPISSNDNIGSLTQGIYSGYDSEFRECHFTITNSVNNTDSFVVSDLDAKLVTKLQLKSDSTTTSFGSIFFKKYIPYKNRLYGVGHETSSQDNDAIYLFNSDVYQHFNFGFVVNDNATINKVFDSSEIITDVTNTTDKFTAHMLEDSIGNNSVGGGAFERIREGIHRLPLRGSSDTHRMRGNWLKHTITYYQTLTNNSIDSSNDKKFNIFAVNTRYRQSR